MRSTALRSSHPRKYLKETREDHGSHEGKVKNARRLSEVQKTDEDVHGKYTSHVADIPTKPGSQESR